MIPAGGFPQLPDPATWDQFPVVAVIVLCFAAAGTGIFYFIRWVWTEFKAEQVRQRTFEAEQNLLRETNIKAQNDLWRQTIMEIETRRDENDVVHEQTLQQLTGILGAHDQQAKEILGIVRRIDEHTQPTTVRKGPTR
jgi:hypothetical protein